MSKRQAKRTKQGLQARQRDFDLTSAGTRQGRTKPGSLNRKKSGYAPRKGKR
jgi:hypothetical protein